MLRNCCESNCSYLRGEIPGEFSEYLCKVCLCKGVCPERGLLKLRSSATLSRNILCYESLILVDEVQAIYIYALLAEWEREFCEGECLDLYTQFNTSLSRWTRLQQTYLTVFRFGSVKHWLGGKWRRHRTAGADLPLACKPIPFNGGVACTEVLKHSRRIHRRMQCQQKSSAVRKPLNVV